MKTRKGYWASAVFLCAIPAALIFQTIFGSEAETVLHFSFAVGSGLLCLAAFDFRMPLPIRIAGAVVTSSIAIIFTLQAVSNLIQNTYLRHIAFDVLGQRPERLLINALLLWLVAVLFY